MTNAQLQEILSQHPPDMKVVLLCIKNEIDDEAPDMLWTDEISIRRVEAKVLYSVERDGTPIEKPVPALMIIPDNWEVDTDEEI